MFNTLKTIGLASIFAFGFLIISTFSSAQESQQYKRYFEIEVNQSIDPEKDVNLDLFRDTPFEMSSYCSSANSILISVPAVYPKRVYQIEEEIKRTLEKVIPSDKIESLHTVKASELESFCQ